MAKIRAIKSMITGEEGGSQPPETTGGSSLLTAQTEGAVLTLASEQQAGRSKKRLRKEKAGPSLVDEESTKLESNELGDQAEQQPRKTKGKGPATPPVWAPELRYQGQPVSAEDSVCADKDYSIGFNMTKGLILPADMKRHDELSDLKVLRSAAKSIVLAAQKNYLAHERMVAVQQSLRDAITENKVQKADMDMLKAEQEVVKAERDELRQKVDRAEEEKNRAAKKAKARYLAELRKLRDAHKAEMEKAVEAAEDRGYAQGEKTYERQVQATKDIFFQCGWKAAVEKLGLGQDAEMFINPPAAYIPVFMQAYANATQTRLIAEARKEAEEEAAAQKQSEQTPAEKPAEQTPSDASPSAEDEAIDREVVAVEVSDKGYGLLSSDA